MSRVPWFLAGWCVVTVLGSDAVMAGLTYVYGGPGSQQGKFETAAGDLDLQGWVRFDCVGDDTFWQASTFQASNLNEHGPGNTAMWAGQSAAQLFQPAVDTVLSLGATAAGAAGSVRSAGAQGA